MRLSEWSRRNRRRSRQGESAQREPLTPAERVTLVSRFESTGELPDDLACVQALVSTLRTLTGVYGPGFSYHAKWLFHLRKALKAWFDRTRDIACLNEAITVLRDAESASGSSELNCRPASVFCAPRSLPDPIIPATSPTRARRLPPRDKLITLCRPLPQPYRHHAEPRQRPARRLRRGTLPELPELLHRLNYRGAAYRAYLLQQSADTPLMPAQCAE